MDPVLAAELESFAEWWSAKLKEGEVREAITQPLYHYTTLQGLRGIVESERLWFTDFRHLNDPMELTHGIGIALREIERHEFGRHREVRSIQYVVRDTLEHRLTENFGFYLTSLTFAGDETGQWRDYASNGEGFCIGIDPALFRLTEAIAANPDEAFAIAPVKYERPLLESALREIVRRALTLFQHALHRGMLKDDVQRRMFKTRLSTILSTAIIWVSVTAKRPRFRVEQEVRLIIANEIEKLNPYVQKRARYGHEVPYIAGRLPVNAGSILSVCAGPTASPTDIAVAKQLLAARNFDVTAVFRRSAIPPDSIELKRLTLRL